MLKKYKSERGITLIALIITIIILIILAGISINSLLGENGLITKAKEAKKVQEIATVTENIRLDLILKQSNGETTTLTDAQVLNVLSKYGTVNKNEDGSIKSLTPEGQDYEIPIEDIWKENIEESFDNTRKVNKPVLASGMIPVKYNGTNWVICSQTDEEWYDYEDKKWANVMLSDGTYKDKTQIGQVVEDEELGSMFVWIPRYAYSINQYKTQIGSSTVGEGTTQEITNVTFLVGTSSKDKDGNAYNADYNVEEAVVGNATPKIVHPAFNFGGTNLPGIWSAKFEASMEETNNNTTANNNTSKTIKIVPNAESWRYIQIGNIFVNCLNMKDNEMYGLSNADTHLMKNNEWGAIAYLATSQYGSTPTFNGSGVSYTEDSTTKYHSYSAGGDYKTNALQSTTGNVTGIYDLNGGAWEYVVAYWDNGNGNLSGNGLTAFENNVLKTEYTKYWDKYEVSENEINEMNDGLWDKDYTYNNIRKQITDERVNLMKSIKGDALYEVFNTYSYYGKMNDNTYQWGMDESFTSAQYGRTYYNNDFALVGNTSLPFLRRGGSWNVGSYAGVFASHGISGGAGNVSRFPPGLGGVVENMTTFFRK